MKRAFTASTLFVVVLLVIAFGCRSGGSNMATSETQQEIGSRMAKMNLWREAMFRFKRAVELDPENAQAHSNLAVAYEANGDFENAAKEYREALRLDRSNAHIQKNYSRFIEFTSRSKKRQQPKTATTATDTTGTAPMTAATPPSMPAPPPPTDTTATTPVPPPPMGDH